MKVPFNRELDDPFRSDRAIGLKMLGCGLVSTFCVIAEVLKNTDSPAMDVMKPAQWAFLIAIVPTMGASLGLVMGLKDTVVRRLDSGEPVARLLKVYFGMRVFSLLAWFATVMFLGLLTMVLYISIRYG